MTDCKAISYICLLKPRLRSISMQCCVIWISWSPHPDGASKPKKERAQCKKLDDDDREEGSQDGMANDSGDARELDDNVKNVIAG